MYERQNLMATFFKSSKVSFGVFSVSLSSLERQISTPDFLLCCSMFFSHSFFPGVETGHSQEALHGKVGI